MVEKEDDMSDAAFLKKFGKIRAAIPGSEVLINADKRAPDESILSIVMLARKAGFSRVGLVMHYSGSEANNDDFYLRYE